MSCFKFLKEKYPSLSNTWPGNFRDFFFSLSKIDLIVVQRAKKMSKADFLFWRLDNKYITEIIKHCDQKATRGQSRTSSSKGQYQTILKIIYTFLTPELSLLKTQLLFVSYSFMLCASPHHYFIQLFEHFLSASLCTAFRVLSKPDNLKEIQRQEIPNEYLVKSCPCKGSILQKTINKVFTT